jgi:hypothetical protein
MKTVQDGFIVRASVAGVRAAVVAMAFLPAAFAADNAAPDPAATAQTQPTNSVEAGVGYVSQDSFKFGQYNGLFNRGPYAIFNFDLRGGGAFDSESTQRYRIFGTNIGLDNRYIYGEFGAQGTYNVWGSYDQLRSNYGTGDSYQTPFGGAGSNQLTLPSNWVKPIVPQVSTSAGNFRALSPDTGLANSIVGGVSTPPTAAQQAIVNNIIANDVPAFQNVELETTRKTAAGGFSYNLAPRWVFAASASQTQQDGVKPLSMLSLSSGTVAAILPNLIDQTTNQYNASLTYTGEQLFVTGAYYGSYYTNHVQSMVWENAFNPGTFASMSTAPSNEFNQFSLKGGYNFSPTTKLTMGASYGRGTQDQGFLADGVNLPVGAPASSLDGLVETTQFNARLSFRPVKALNANVGYRYLDRDNKTPINTYMSYDAGEPATGASPFNATLASLGLVPPGTSLGSNINIYNNRPYSKKSNEVNADASYALAPGQSIKGEYLWQQIDRSCTGSWINCADATKSTENTLRVAYDATMAGTVTGRLSYAYSWRDVDYDPNAWLALVPMANYTPTGAATTSAYQFMSENGLGGYGPNAPWVPLQPGNLGVFFPNNSALPQNLYGSRNDIHEIPGLQRYNQADRRRNRLRGAVNWDASDVLAIAGNVDYIDDDYSNSTYGLTSAKGLMANVEANWTASESFSATLYYTYEEQRAKSSGLSYSAGQITNTANVGGVAGNTVVSGGCFSTVQDRNMNAKIDPCLNWFTNMKDKVHTIGASFDWKNLAAGRLELIGNALYSDARTDVGVSGGTYANNPFALSGRPAVDPAVLFIPAADLPTVTQKLLELQLAGQYKIDNRSMIRMFYGWHRLRVTDYAYDGMQYGSLTGIMPTNEQAPNYNVSVVGLSYILRWQ